jgi:hypothetical protein
MSQATGLIHCILPLVNNLQVKSPEDKIMFQTELFFLN